MFEAEAFSGAKYALVKEAGATSSGPKPQDQVTGATAGGKPVSISFGCSDATPDKAVSEARRLVENEKVDILLGPLSGDEGIAVANYAKTQPQVTFVNGTSGAQETTLSVKAPNFFRFGGDGAQWMAGLGSYAYNDLGWRKTAILGEDYSYPYTQAAGFTAEFCGLGGQITKRVWAPLDTTDWSSYVAQLPRDVDGVLLLTGGANTINALKAYTSLGQQIDGHVLGGSSVLDPTAFAVGDQLKGLTGGSPVPLGGTTPDWTSYVDGFSKVYDKKLAASLFTVLYYDGMQAIVQGLDQVKGDLSERPGGVPQGADQPRPDVPRGQGHARRQPQRDPAGVRRAGRGRQRRARVQGDQDDRERRPGVRRRVQGGQPGAEPHRAAVRQGARAALGVQLAPIARRAGGAPVLRVTRGVPAPRSAASRTSRHDSGSPSPPAWRSCAAAPRGSAGAARPPRRATAPSRPR